MASPLQPDESGRAGPMSGQQPVLVSTSDAARWADLERRLRQDLERATSAASELQVIAAESATRGVESEQRLAELERELESYRGRRQYEQLVRTLGQSRVLRAATTLARWATLRSRRRLFLWQDPDRLRAYVDRCVESALEVASAPPVPAEAVWGVPVISPPDRDVVRVGMASIPGRVEGLMRVVDALYDQADEIYVYLNGYSAAPPGLVKDPRIKLFTGPDIGDRAKFRFVKGFRGYYLSVDDDIAYPSFYVDHLIDGIERYQRRAIVGWHGSAFKEPFFDYYSSQCREVFSFRATQELDAFVHILGTGCMGFHSDTIELSVADFSRPNMADVFLSRKAQLLGVPRVVLAHRKGWATPLTFDDQTSIYSDSRDRRNSTSDVGAETNRRIAALSPWTLQTVLPVAYRPLMRMAVIDDIDEAGNAEERASLLRDMLAPYNVDIRRFPSDPAGLAALGGFAPHVTMIYPADPAHLEVGGADDLIEPCVRSDGVVLVDLSVDLREARSKVIVDLVESWRACHGGRVRLMTFADATAQAAGLERVEDLTVTVPMPLRISTRAQASFSHSAGVLLGNATSLSDELSLSEPLEEWVAAIRAALPSATLYAVASGGAVPSRGLGLELISEAVLGDRLTTMRLMVSPARHSTFETLPIVAAAAGVPVVYRRAEHLLSAYLGTGGIEVRAPAELAGILPLLYHDPALWRAQSAAGLRRAQSLDRRVLGAELYLTLRRLVGPAGPVEQEAARNP